MKQQSGLQLRTPDIAGQTLLILLDYNWGNGFTQDSWGDSPNTTNIFCHPMKHLFLSTMILLKPQSTGWHRQHSLSDVDVV